MDEASERRRGMSGYYDRLAPLYGEGVLFAARRTAVLDAIAAEIGTARAILDLGCGNGAFAADLVERSPRGQWIGADLSPEMLAAARRRLGERSALVRADATALPFRARSFDLAFMSHVLLLIADLESCIAQIAACLRPNGTFAATVGAGRWRDALRAFLGADDVRALEDLFGAGLRPADEGDRAVRACRAAGLEVESRQAPFSVGWRDLDEWIHVRWLSLLDEASRAAAEAWLARIGERVGGARLAFAEHVLVARRGHGSR